MVSPANRSEALLYINFQVYSLHPNQGFDNLLFGVEFFDGCIG